MKIAPPTAPQVHGPARTDRCHRKAARLAAAIAVLIAVSVANAAEPAERQSSADPSSTPNQDAPADFELWRTFDERTRGRVDRDQVDPHWFGAQQDKFWYRVNSGPDQHEFILVDAAAGVRKPAFDHDQLAAALAAETETTISAEQLELSQLRFDEMLQICQFDYGGRDWQFTLPGGPLRSNTSPQSDGQGPKLTGLRPLDRIQRSRGRSSRRTPIEFDNRLEQALQCFWVTPEGELQSYGFVAATSTRELSTYPGHAWVLKTESGEAVAAFVAEQRHRLALIDSQTPSPKPMRRSRERSQPRGPSTSPDGNWMVRFEQGNLIIVDTQTGEEMVLTDDAGEQRRYGPRVWWAPDSSGLVVMRTDVAEQRTISMIDSAPEDSIHAELITIPYAKPGDAIDHSRPLLIRIDDLQPRLIDDELFPNPYQLSELRWRDDSSSFSFLYNERGHQRMRLIAVDAESAEPRVVIDESIDTFICYSSKTFLRRLDDSNEAIWMSERSGWNHLYLIDTSEGTVKNAITAGEWVVRDVERVDAERRQMWLKVSGINAAEDPYHVHLIRINFDGSGLTRLTDGDGDHQWRYSPDDRFLIDQYSRVDLPPVTELRDSETGRRICSLESADDRRLRETGWQRPERFVAKGRDGETDIYGIIVRPTDFDPQRRYPVLEAIYAGPHSAFTPKNFGRHADLYQMAELGFIVVKLDGMGTNHRSKAFHDVCWKNIADSGFPDRIAWTRAAAKQHPEMDLGRVGIWGGSAGGQSAMRALIAHGDFYHAAVADCGCHDNRVDKRWWNEQWMGWPIGPHYREQSNVTQAHRLQGDLLLIWGELDRNVDPASTMQVVDALIRADKDFEMLIMPGVGHGAAGRPYAKRRQAEFFVRKLKN